MQVTYNIARAGGFNNYEFFGLMIRFSASHYPHPQVHPAQNPSENHKQGTTRTSQGSQSQ